MSEPEPILIDLERKFWLDGADYYREHLADEFLMLFPGIGVMGRDEAIRGIEAGRRWTDVEIRDARVLDLGSESRLLCYRVNALRQGDEKYAALVSSVYVNRNGAWKLTFHQQSPGTA